MSSNFETHLRRLRSDSNKERLEAARYFAEYALPGHETPLREALAAESILWIRGALRRALARISPISDPDTSKPIDRDDLPEGFAAEVYAEALQTTTSQVMHEIEPLLGSLRLAAGTEITDFESSETRRALDRLDEFLEALSRLRRAASAPKVEEFSLDEIVQRCIQDSSVPQNVQIQRSGPQPCVAEGDSGLISLSLANGLRNSVEATVAASKESGRLPVIVTWGTTDVEYWISVVDNGIGFKGDVHRAFDVGTSTKAGHLGMGLAIASQALTSMGGRILLIPNERGVRFEMRWPKAAGEVDASSSR